MFLLNRSLSRSMTLLHGSSGGDAARQHVRRERSQPYDPPGITRITVLFYPEVGLSNRSVYRAITLSGIEAFRFARKPLFYFAPKGLLDEYLHLNLNTVQAGEPELVVLAVNNETGKVVSAAYYDPATTCAGDATKAGHQTSDLSEADVEALVATACPQDSPHFQTAPNISAKTGCPASMRPNCLTSGRNRIVGMLGMSS